MGTKEIAEKIRKELKEKFPRCKFSVTTQYFSGGSSIHVALMKSNVRVLRKLEEIPESAIKELGSLFSREFVKQNQSLKYHQLNAYQLDEFDVNKPCNGVFLTEKGHNLLRGVVEIVKKYHWEESDLATDYFNCNFFFELSLGKCNKEFEDGED